MREWHQVHVLVAAAAAPWLHQAPNNCASCMAAEAAATYLRSSIHIGFFLDQFRHNALMALLGRNMQSSPSILRKKRMEKIECVSGIKCARSLQPQRHPGSTMPLTISHHACLLKQQRHAFVAASTLAFFSISFATTLSWPSWAAMYRAVAPL